MGWMPCASAHPDPMVITRGGQRNTVAGLCETYCPRCAKSSRESDMSSLKGAKRSQVNHLSKELCFSFP